MDSNIDTSWPCFDSTDGIYDCNGEINPMPSFDPIPTFQATDESNYDDQIHNPHSSTNDLVDFRRDDPDVTQDRDEGLLNTGDTSATQDLDSGTAILAPAVNRRRAKRGRRRPNWTQKPKYDGCQSTLDSQNNMKELKVSQTAQRDRGISQQIRAETSMEGFVQSSKVRLTQLKQLEDIQNTVMKYRASTHDSKCTCINGETSRIWLPKFLVNVLKPSLPGELIKRRSGIVMRLTGSDR